MPAHLKRVGKTWWCSDPPLTVPAAKGGRASYFFRDAHQRSAPAMFLLPLP